MRRELAAAARRLATGPAGAVLVAVLLTAAMAAPVLRHPTTRLFGSEIVGRHVAPFVVISQFESPPPPSRFTQPATDLPGALLARLLGSGVAAVNAVILASFPLATLFAWLLAYELTGSRRAAWVAGLAYAFAPFHVAQAAYHPHGAQIHWLPLYLLALWRSLERATPGRLALLAVATPLVVLSNFYYGLIAAVVTPAALAGRWLADRTAVPRRGGRGWLATLAVLAALAAAGAAFVAWWAPTVLSDPAALAWPRSDLTQYSARWWSYLLPPVGHPLFAAAVESYWAGRHPGGLLSHQLTVGVGLLLLAAAALRLWWGGERGRELRAAPALVVVGAVALLCSLPPDWGLAGRSLLAPSGLLYELVPMFRAYSRFGLVVLLAAAILAGGAVAVLTRRSRRQVALALALLLLAAVELTPAPPQRWRDVLPTRAHRWLSGQSGVQVLDCGPGSDGAVRSAARFFDGHLGFLDPGEECGDPGMPAALAAGGYTHLIVPRPAPLDDWIDRAGPPEGLAAVRLFEDSRVLALRAPAGRLHLRFAAGFHWREFQGVRSYRWMGESGRLRLVNPGSEPLEAVLELTLHGFPGARRVEVALDAGPLATLEVGAEPGPHRLPPFVVPPGEHQLGLRSLAPSAVPDEVIGNGDRRALTVALWEWRWIAGDGAPGAGAG